MVPKLGTARTTLVYPANPVTRCVLGFVAAVALACGETDTPTVGSGGAAGAPAAGGSSGALGGSPGLGGASGGQGGAPIVDTPGIDSFAEAADFIGTTCGVSGCHLLPYPPSLSKSDLERLRETLRTYTVERCGNIPLVVPGNPDGSALVLAITGVCPNLLMPVGCVEPYGGVPCIQEDQVARLRDWIASEDPFR